jgi:hypothetical protein
MVLVYRPEVPTPLSLFFFLDELDVKEEFFQNRSAATVLQHLSPTFTEWLRAFLEAEKRTGGSHNQS